VVTGFYRPKALAQAAAGVRISRPSWLDGFLGAPLSRRVRAISNPRPNASSLIDAGTLNYSCEIEGRMRVSVYAESTV